MTSRNKTIEKRTRKQTYINTLRWVNHGCRILQQPIQIGTVVFKGQVEYTLIQYFVLKVCVDYYIK